MANRKNAFLKNITQKSEKKAEKAPFDKKKWRTQKYSMKSKVQNWEERRKRAILNDYRKETKRSRNEPKFDVNKIYEAEEEEVAESSDEDCQSTSKKNNLNQQFQTKFEERQHRREELQKTREEKELAIKKQRKEKMQRFKKINKKTKKGQPVMKGRLEDLLERIQTSIAPTSTLNE